MQFYKGQPIICRDDRGSRLYLKVGQTYVIADEPDGLGFFIQCGHEQIWFKQSRFEPALATPDEFVSTILLFAKMLVRRPIKTGDSVKHKTRGPAKYEVLAVNGEYAWVFGGYAPGFIEYVRYLERV